MSAEDPQQRPRPRNEDRRLAAVILAAGQSTRMKSDLPKVLHPLCGRPLLDHVIRACREAGIERLTLVVGFGRARITRAYAGAPGIHFVEQAEQKGTGHAVSVCAEALRDFDGELIVLAGDMPLVRPQTLRALVESHRAAGAAATLATTTLDDPTGYGRILRDADGRFERIVEHRDCSEDQLQIREVNPSYYCFDARALFDALPAVRPDNAKGEYYITDVLGILRRSGRIVQAAQAVPADDAAGINSRADLADVARRMQRRIHAHWMNHAVTIVDPATTWIDSPAVLGPDSEIRPFTCIEGEARIGAGCRIGPYAYIPDGAVVPDGARVGPGTFEAPSARGGRPPAAHRRAAPVVRRRRSHAAAGPAPDASDGPCAGKGGSC